ncbi:MAG: hypothetical protein SGI77_22915 [Pirellulaceae bacterium]|nr:hypothetical protein [Pirellulaceae bacterium]
MVISFASGANRSDRNAVASMNIRAWVKRSIVGLAFGMLTASSVVADSTGESQSSKRLINLQSQDIELPEDFLVKVDGDKLQVALVSVGAIESQMSTANLLVRLFDSSGEEKVATSNQRGIAEFRGVKGDEMHALLVADAKAHVSLPVMTVSARTAAENNIETTSFKMPVMQPNPKEILVAINRDIPPTTGPAGEVYSANELDPQPVTTYRVRLQNDGDLLGRVVVLDRELADKLRYAKLTFMRNDQVVARTDSTPSDGSFFVQGLTEGLHGVIAAGPAGYASFAFDVLPAVGGESLPREGILGKPVSYIAPNLNERLNVCLCPPRYVPQITNRIREAYGPPIGGVASQSGLGTPFGGGGFGGGGFGGGGFGGGGGGFGGGGLGGGGFGNILGLAGLAGIAAVIANDNNNNNTVISPITTTTTN